MFDKSRRYSVAIYAFFGFFNLFFYKGSLSIAIVAMTQNKTIQMKNETISKSDFDWNLKLQGYILSSFFYGYISSQLLWGWASAKIGGKRIFGGGIAVAALLNLLIPWLTTISVYFLIILRFLSGFFGAVACPGLSALWTKWVPPLEKSKMVAIAYVGGCVGTVVIMPVCAYLAEFLGWQSIFYVSSVSGLLWSLIWFKCVAETPAQDSKISQKELNYIRKCLGSNSGRKVVNYPWKKIATSLPVWAIIFASFTECWGIYTLLILAPKFLNDIFKIELSETGFLTSLPFMSMIVGLLFSGFLADWLLKNTSLTTTQVRKCFSCGAFTLCGCLILCMSFYMEPLVIITCITLAGGITVSTEAGSGVNHFDVAPEYASLIMGISNTIGNLGGALSPIIAGYVVTEHTPEKWRFFFFITCGIYLFGSIFYGMFGTGKTQKWAGICQDTDETTVHNENINL